ncbi:MAG: DUF4097 family beta strand repeat protein [Clostridia bacterium]|nr:DUF4097 family beta strand repeat protein [Clostridia bacterium]
MTAKNDFMERLDALTTALPESERERLRSYFAEMIDDRVAMGMDEDVAVEALGAPEALLRDVAPDAPADAAPDDHACVGEIREIHIHMKNADVQVISQPLNGGMSAQLKASETDRFTWRLEDGVLTVSETDKVRRAFFRRSAKLSLILSDFVPEKLIVDSYGGDLDVAGVEIADTAVLTASSGDIRLVRVSCGGRLEATSSSGDIILRQMNAQRLRVRTTSGDAECDGLRAVEAAFAAVSGDLELKGIAVEDSLTCETTSGDVELERASAAQMRLSTASGDIKVRLASGIGPAEVRAVSRSGDVKAPFADIPNARCKIQANSQSGDIDIK